MQVSSATSTQRSALASDDSPTAPLVTGKKVLGQADFMKLLAVQFQSQDPMKPMEDTAFIAQMAQFSALDQSSSLVQQMTQLRTNQDIVTANSYIGRQVTLSDGKNPDVVGNVSGVDASSGSPRLMVGNKTFPISAVLKVEPGVPQSSASPSSNPVSV